jgi:hypothetical protein
VSAVQAFFDHVTQNEPAICAELSSDDCDRLVAMTHALWASALMYDETAGPTTDLWFERREVVIYYNLRTHLAAQTDRMFLHMGAAHTNKGENTSRGYQSAGGRMAHMYPLTKGQVFSIAPAYGNGSVTWYGQELELPGEPVTIISSLTDSPPHPVFVSTTRPSDECVANPLATELEDNAGIPRAEAYDGYVHYGQLTSETRPKDTSLERETDDGKRSFRALRARIERKERAALAGLRTSGLALRPRVQAR